MKMEEIVQSRLRTVFQDDSIVYDKTRFAGGLTNYNYIMNIHGTEYVIRQPGGMTNAMIDRSIEKVNSGIASELGLNSECLDFDEDTGVKISYYIKDSKNIAIAGPTDPALLKEVSRLMKMTHASKTPFPNEFSWISELTKYEKIVLDQNGEFFFDYTKLKQQLIDYILENIKETKLAPCHNDTVPENFLVAPNGATYLIDWEYAGMNDPNWDVAAYILESKLPKEAIEILTTEFYGRPPVEEELLKIKCYMLEQDLLWTVWSLVRHYSGEDFLDYCYLRYERFKKNLSLVTGNREVSLAELVNQ